MYMSSHQEVENTHKIIQDLTQHLSIKARVISAYKKAGMIKEEHPTQLQAEYHETTKELSELTNKLLCPICRRVPWNHGSTCENSI
jgi:chromosome segregation ATPase